MPIFFSKHQSATRPEWSSFCGAQWSKKAVMEDGICRPKPRTFTFSPCIDRRAELCKQALSATHLPSCLQRPSLCFSNPFRAKPK